MTLTKPERILIIALLIILVVEVPFFSWYWHDAIEGYRWLVDEWWVGDRHFLVYEVDR